jgi:catechol 2,3-dioxygenase-like lactoylglutathione lyase family enzyme
VRLNHVMVAVSDLERSVAFYRLLGLRQIVADEGYARFELPDGDSTLSLESRSGGKAGGTIVYFEYVDVDAAAAELKAKGIELEQDPVDQPYLWREALLRDPDGNAICLFHAGENRLNPPWRLD